MGDTTNTNSSNSTVESGTMQFLLENLGPVIATTGCVTVALFGLLLGIQKESKKRVEQARIDAEYEVQESLKAAAKNAMVDRTKYPGGKITVYYATQTGTAESFAKDLEREGRDHGFLLKIEDVEELDSNPQLLVGIENYEGPTESKSRIPYGPTEKTEDNVRPRAIILAATYGEGEPTDNATELVNAMKEIMEVNKNPSPQTAMLKNLDYCVFGLGNTEYEIFNAMGKFFDSSLEVLGGTRILKLGVGDDSDDLEGDFEKWKDLLWTTLKRKYIPQNENGGVSKKAKKKGTESTKLPDCVYAIDYHTEMTPLESFDSDVNRGTVPLDSIALSSKNSHYFTAIDCPVSTVKELRSTTEQNNYGSTVHVEIDISEAGHAGDYMTADNLGVLPCNSNAVVEAVALALGYKLDSVFSVKAGKNPDGEVHEWHGVPFPTPLSVRELLTRYLDLTSAPRRSDLKLLSHYAKPGLDRKVLQRLSSKEGKQDYRTKIMDAKVGLVQLLQLCPSIQIPLEHLIGNICRLQLPRFYTISSCPKVYPTSIHLTVSVTQEKRPTTSDGRGNGNNDEQPMFEGVCSTHIAAASQQNHLRVFVRPSTFRLPTELSTPIIMIGPGTGIAPMRALLQDRQHTQEQQKLEGKPHHCTNVLYFGCQQAEVDYLYREELADYREKGLLTDLHVAFSRKDPTQKEYVQHLLRRNSKETYQLVRNEGAYVYVCGGVKMGHDVTETLKEIFMEQSSVPMTKDDTTNYLAQLSKDGRFVQELWS